VRQSRRSSTSGLERWTTETDDSVLLSDGASPCLAGVASGLAGHAAVAIRSNFPSRISARTTGTSVGRRGTAWIGLSLFVVRRGWTRVFVKCTGLRLESCAANVCRCIKECSRALWPTGSAPDNVLWGINPTPLSCSGLYTRLRVRTPHSSGKLMCTVWFVTNVRAPKSPETLTNVRPKIEPCFLWRNFSMPMSVKRFKNN